MLTKGAIGNLVNRYRAVLKKCHLMNTFGSLAVAAMLVAGGVVSASAADNNDLKPVNGALTLYYDGSLYGDTSLDIKVNEDKSVTANVQDKTAGYGVLTNYHDNDAISDIIITGSTFKNNTQENGPWTQGGTVSLWDSGYAGTDSVKKEINQTTFESNTAAGVGGAVAIFKGADYDVAGTTNFNEVTFTQNSGSIGGAVLAEAENLIFNGGSFKRNDAAGRGGAIYLTIRTACSPAMKVRSAAPFRSGATISTPKNWQPRPDQAILHTRSITLSLSGTRRIGKEPISAKAGPSPSCPSKICIMPLSMLISAT